MVVESLIDEVDIVFYSQAIMEVGEVIQFYDSDRKFPAWGFGGRAPNNH